MKDKLTYHKELARWVNIRMNASEKGSENSSTAIIVFVVKKKSCNRYGTNGV